MEEKNIFFKVDSKIEKIPMKDIDFVVLLGNLLDNAIEAAEKCEEGKGKITCIFRNINDMFIFKVKNTSIYKPYEKNTKFYTSKKEINFKIFTLKVLTSPPLIALVIALLLMGVEFHPVISKVLSSFANTIVPIALVAVGLQLQFKLPREDLKPFSVALFIKLIIAPIIAIVICKIFNWNNQAAMVSIMEAAMAPMITAGAIASMAGLAPRLSSAIVGYGILISFVTTGILFKLIS